MSSSKPMMTTAASEGLERDEYRTPKEIFDGLNCKFDLDVAAPCSGITHVPCSHRFTSQTNGLTNDWIIHQFSPFVWMNPPFGKRNGVVPWLRKFFEHGHGIGLVNALTSAGWFHDWIDGASGLLFPKGKTRFLRPDGSSARQPVTGIVLFSAGEHGRKILRDSTIDGLYLEQCHDFENGAAGG